MKSKFFVLAVLLLSIVACQTASGPAPDPGPILNRIAFGSCARSDRDQPIWESIVASDPELFLFAGDNIYADLIRVPRQKADITAKYVEFAVKPGWALLNRQCPILATWDDHDFGKDDAGVEWELKDASQEAFLEFFAPDAGPERRSRAGVYHSETFGPVGFRVQVILLDTRYHRTGLTKDAERRAAGFGPYVPNASTEGTLLGEEQWAWLGERLRERADVRLIVSSIQVVSEEHGWECWANMAHERQRLYDLIRSTRANGVVVLSGDRHLLEISVDENRGPYPIWDFTSSGFNWGESQIKEANRFRRGGVFREPNFGVVSIDWDRLDPVITLEGRNGEGRPLVKQSIPLSSLR